MHVSFQGVKLATKMISTWMSAAVALMLVVLLGDVASASTNYTSFSAFDCASFMCLTKRTYLKDYLENGCSGSFSTHFTTTVALEESVATVGFTTTMVIALSVLFITGLVGFKLSKVKKTWF